MPRPLVWVGVAYTLGAAWAAGGQNIFYGIAGIAFCMWITGRIRQSWTGMWLFWFLPVFFVSGFVIFGHSMQEIRDDTSEDQYAVLRGIVWQCEEKEKSYAVTLSDVEIGDIKTRVLVYADKDREAVQVGDGIEVRGILQKPERASNPGQFDPRSYYYGKGISYLMRTDQMEVVSKGHSYRRLLQKLRVFWSERYSLFLDEKDAGVVKAVLVGDKSEMDEETEQLYVQAGIVHILAISGVKTLKLDIPLVPETRINRAFVPLHIAIIYILKLCLDVEIIPRCRFPCSRGYLTKCINWQKKQYFSISLILWQKYKKWQKEKIHMAYKKYREMKVYETSGYQYKRTPSIVLKGKWLSELGFDIGEQIEVKCEDGRLVITKANEIWSNEA